MRIKSFRIQNYRSIRDIKLNFPDSGIMILAGENASGKSNIVRALYNIFGKNWWGKNLEITEYHNFNPKNKIKISIKFDNGYSVEFDDKGHWPRYIDDKGKEIFASKSLIKDDYPAVMLEAERDFHQFFSFRRWSTFGKIGTILDKEILQSDTAEKLRGKIREIAEIIGENKLMAEFESYMQEISADLGLNKLSFSLLSSLRPLSGLSVGAKIEKGFFADFDTLSSSEKSLIAISVLISYARIFLNSDSGLIILENPEIYLTPMQQENLYKFLQSFVTNTGYQIIITTSSAHLIAMAEMEEMVRVYKKGNQTYVKQLNYNDIIQQNQPISTKDLQQTLKYSINPQLTAAILASKVILAQNNLIQQLISTIFKVNSFPLSDQNIAVVNAGGKRQAILWTKILAGFGQQVICVVENYANRNNRDNDFITQFFKTSAYGIENFEENYKEIELQKNIIMLVINPDINTMLINEFSKFIKQRNLPLDTEKLKASFSGLGLDQDLFWIYAAEKTIEQDRDFLRDFFLVLHKRLRQFT